MLEEAIKRPIKWIIWILLLPVRLLLNLVGQIISIIISVILLVLIVIGLAMFFGVPSDVSIFEFIFGQII